MGDVDEDVGGVGVWWREARGCRKRERGGYGLIEGAFVYWDLGTVMMALKRRGMKGIEEMGKRFMQGRARKKLEEKGLG